MSQPAGQNSGQRCSTYLTEKISHLSVMPSSLHGLGCFATVHFPKESAIAEYAGERINQNEAIRRMTRTNGKQICQLDTVHYIDGSVGGNATQYINHSCEPNADVLVIDDLLLVFALRDIL